MAIALGQFEGTAAGNDEAHPGNAFQTLAGSRHQGVEGNVVHVDRDGAIRTHRIDDQPAASRRHDGGNLGQRVQDACAGFAVHLRRMADRRVGRQCGVDTRRIGGFILAVFEHHDLSLIHI